MTMPILPFVQYPALQQPAPLFGDESGNATRWYKQWADPDLGVSVRNQARAALIASGQTLDPEPRGTPEFVGPDKWWQPFSERLYPKAGLRADLQRPLEWTPQPFHPDTYGWFLELSVPQKLTPPMVLAANQPFFTLQPTPIIDISWFNWLSEPKRFPPAIIVGNQNENWEEVEPEELDMAAWFRPFSEPKRFPRRLDESNQPYFTTGAHSLGTPYARGYIIC